MAITAITSVTATAANPGQSPKRVYGVGGPAGATGPDTTAGTKAPALRITRPRASISHDNPVLAQRATATWFSTARNTAIAACCSSAVLRPNHSSLVTFTSHRAP